MGASAFDQATYFSTMAELVYSLLNLPKRPVIVQFHHQTPLEAIYLSAGLCVPKVLCLLSLCYCQ